MKREIKNADYQANLLLTIKELTALDSSRDIAIFETEHPELAELTELKALRIAHNDQKSQ